MQRSLTRLALLAIVAGLPACSAATLANPASELAIPSESGEEDRLLRVTSNYWSPLDIELVGDGVRRKIGTVQRLQPRTFRIPARLVASGAFVSLDARDVVASTGYSTGLFTLAEGDTVDLLLEHTLTLSTFAIKRRK
jgi:hypothetical protein